ncbi:MAG: replication protein, partial [Syntrophomonadaceae bacterium]|nr:replication protein [Syntrophomonadaceae bacterium]
MTKSTIDILKDDYPQIPAKILEALDAADINRTQIMLCTYILRQTYEDNRSAAPIYFREFGYLKNVSLPWIKNQLRLLIERKIVICLEENPGEIGFYIINPKVSEWEAKRPYNQKA